MAEGQQNEPDPKSDDPAKGGSDDPNPGDLGDAGKKALDAERKARRDAEAAQKAAEAKLQELEDAEKSEVQKLNDQLARAKEDAEKASARADRLEVAIEKGLTATQAKRLVGSTKEELEADADDLVASFGGADDAKSPGTQKPKTDLQKGNDPDEDDDAVDAKELADQILDKGY